jgi:hypothetical protein
LSALPARFGLSQVEGRLDHPNLVRLQGVFSDAQVRFNRASPLVDTAAHAVTAQRTAISAIDQNIAVLEAARTDLMRRAQLADLLKAEERDREGLAGGIE